MSAEPRAAESESEAETGRADESAATKGIAAADGGQVSVGGEVVDVDGGGVDVAAGNVDVAGGNVDVAGGNVDIAGKTVGPSGVGLDALGDEDSIGPLWKAVLDDWADDKRHKALVTYAIQTQRIDAATKRYKLVVDTSEDADRKKDAKARLDKLMTAAILMLEATKTSTDTNAEAKAFAKKLSMGFLVLVLLVLAYSLFRMATASTGQ